MLSRNKSSRRGFLHALKAAVVMAGLGFAGFAHAQSADMDKLVADAKAEGQITIYSAAPENIVLRIVKSFRDKYGIEIKYVRISSNQLKQRFSAEAEAGAIAADLMFIAGGPTPYFKEVLAKGWLTPIKDAKIPVLDDGTFPAKFSDGLSAVVQVAPFLIAYNKDHVSDADAPKDWPDLLDPKYKGQIILIDPRASNAFLDVYAAIEDKYGKEFFDKLVAQEPRRYADGTPATQGLAAGEAALEIPVLPSMVNELIAKGAPLGQSIPSYTSGVEMHVALTDLSKAKSPATARLLANFVMTEEGNKIFNADPGSASVYDTTQLPAEYKAPVPETVERKDAILKLLQFN